MISAYRMQSDWSNELFGFIVFFSYLCTRNQKFVRPAGLTD